MSQKRRQRVVHFPNLRDLQRERLDLDLVVRFAAIGAAYGTARSKYDDIAKRLKNDFPYFARATNPSGLIRECAQKLAKRLGCDPLIINAPAGEGRGTKLSEVGKIVSEWANNVVNYINSQAESPTAIEERRTLVIATHQIFESHALPIVMRKMMTEGQCGPLDVRVEQIEDVHEGIGRLRAGNVDAVLDGVPKSFKFADTERIELGRSFQQVLLIPNSKVDAFSSSGRVTIDDLAHHSLCYVDIPKHVLTQLRVGSRAASFVRVATVASVVRMVEEVQVIGVAVNWKALFEGTGSGSFKVRFIGGNDFEDAHWRLYVRPRQIRETPKRFDGASPLQHLYWELKRFASEQREAFVER